MLGPTSTSAEESHEVCPAADRDRHEAGGGLRRRGVRPRELLGDLTPKTLPLLAAAAGRRRPAGKLNAARPRPTPVFDAPIARTGAVIAIGMNYAAHAAESGSAPPPIPVMFLKTPNTIAGPYDDVPIPARAAKIDWEVELAIVIGKRAYELDRRRRPARPRRRLHRGQRPVGADLPDRGVRRPVEQGQVRARLHPDRPVAGHPRRGRPPEPAAAQLGQRRAAPGLLDRRPDLRLPDDHPAPEPVPGARARRRRAHRHAGGRRALRAASRTCDPATWSRSRSRASAPAPADDRRAPEDRHA